MARQGHSRSVLEMLAEVAGCGNDAEGMESWPGSWCWPECRLHALPSYDEGKSQKQLYSKLF